MISSEVTNTLRDYYGQDVRKWVKDALLHALATQIKGSEELTKQRDASYEQAGKAISVRKDLLRVAETIGCQAQYALACSEENDGSYETWEAMRVLLEHFENRIRQLAERLEA